MIEKLLDGLMELVKEGADEAYVNTAKEEILARMATGASSDGLHMWPRGKTAGDRPQD